MSPEMASGAIIPLSRSGYLPVASSITTVFSPDRSVVPLTLAVFIASVWLYRRSWLASSKGNVSVGPIYWLTMVLAGVLGTVGGDGASFGLRLMPIGAAVVFGVLVAAALVYWYRKGRITDPIPYWTTLALIRTCGTGAGDALSHALGISISTVVMAVMFAGAVLVFYFFERDNQVDAGSALGEAA